MKKSLLALAVLGAFTSVASAQSSVTLFGIVDLSMRYTKNDGAGNRKSMGTSGINSERLGFRGVEDLGGGLKAGFHLEAGMASDTGNLGGNNALPAPTNGSATIFNRRSTASLMGGFGELRLGRDYTPSFWNTTVFDPFGTNGAASSLNVARFSGQPTYVRANNTVGYFLPAMGGVYGQVQVTPSEGVAGHKYTGGRIGFAAGPVNVAAAVGNQEIDLAGNNKFKTFNIAGSYKIGPANLMAQYNNEKIDTNPEQKEVRLLLGTAVTMGQGEFRFSWVRSDDKSVADNDATQIGIGYVYNLSARTALYGHGASISNKKAARFAIAGGNAAPTPGGKSTGYEFGLRHSF